MVLNGDCSGYWFSMPSEPPVKLSLVAAYRSCYLRTVAQGDSPLAQHVHCRWCCLERNGGWQQPHDDPHQRGYWKSTMLLSAWKPGKVGNIIQSFNIEFGKHPKY